MEGLLASLAILLGVLNKEKALQRCALLRALLFSSLRSGKLGSV